MRRRLFTCERTVCSEMKSRFAISSVREVVVEQEQHLDLARGERLRRSSRERRRRGGRRCEPGRAAAARPARRARPRPARRRAGRRRSARAARSSAGSRPRRRGSPRAGSPRCRTRSARRPRSAARPRAGAAARPGRRRPASRGRAGRDPAGGASASSSASAPSAASPTTSKPPCASREARASRVRGWSSTRSMRSDIVVLSSAAARLPIRGTCGENDQRHVRGVARRRAAARRAARLGDGALPDEPVRCVAPTSCPKGRLVLDTAVVLAATIVAILAGARFSVEGRLLDLLLAAGFCVAGVGTLAFAVVPVLGGEPQGPAEAWAALGSRVLAGTSDRARARSCPGRGSRPRRRALRRRTRGRRARACSRSGLAARRSASLSPLDPSSGGSRPFEVTLTLSFLALLALLAVRRLRASLPPPRRGPRQLARARGDADALRRAALRAHAEALERRRLAGRLPPRCSSYGVLLVGVWRAIRAAEFGRAVAEERARVAREIHDGLAQYLFADLDPREHARVGGSARGGRCRS